MNYEAIAFWSQIVAFVLFVIFLLWVWVKFLAPFVKSAQEATNDRIATSQRHRDEMVKSLDVLRTEIETAKRDAAAIESRSADQSQREYDAIVAEATAEGERMLANAAFELDRQRAAAREILRIGLLDEALTLARDHARKRLDAQRAAKLISDFTTAARSVK